MTRAVIADSFIGKNGVTRLAPRGRDFINDKSFHAARKLSAKTGATIMTPGPSMKGTLRDMTSISSIEVGTSGPTRCAQCTSSSK